MKKLPAYEVYKIFQIFNPFLPLLLSHPCNLSALLSAIPADIIYEESPT